MKKEIEQYILNLSDIDLLEYVKTGTESYTPEAIAFAEQELSRRGVTGNLLRAHEEQLAKRIDERKEEAKATSMEPLGTGYRIAVFLCGLFFGIPLLLFVPSWLRFREEGAKRKNRDMWLFALAGVALQIPMVWLNLPPWSWLIGLMSSGRGK
jgi:hypothetical protein